MDATSATLAADVILAAEPIWAGCDPLPLVQTIRRCLLAGQRAREENGERRQGALICSDDEANDSGNSNGDSDGDGNGNCGGGVCFIVMPRGGRGAEDALLAAGRAIGLHWASTPLPLLSSGDAAATASSDEWDDEFMLHEVRVQPQ